MKIDRAYLEAEIENAHEELVYRLRVRAHAWKRHKRSGKHLDGWRADVREARKQIVRIRVLRLALRGLS